MDGITHGWRALQRSLSAQHAPLMPFPDFPVTVVLCGDPCAFTPPGEPFLHALVNVFVVELGAVRVLAIPPEHIDALVGLHFTHGPRAKLRASTFKGFELEGLIAPDERSLIDGSGTYDLEPLIPEYLASLEAQP